MSKLRHYDSEFKQEAIRLVLEDGRRIRDVERSLGITQGLLNGWIGSHRLRLEEAQQSPRPGALLESDPVKQVKRLEKENARLRRERDILKKAVAIFSTEPNQYSGS